MTRTPDNSPTWKLSNKRDERIAFICERFNCTKREAIHVIWCCGYTVGNNSEIWIAHNAVVRHLTMFRNAECEAQLLAQAETA